MATNVICTIPASETECLHDWPVIAPLEWTDAQRRHVRDLVSGGAADDSPACACRSCLSEAPSTVS